MINIIIIPRVFNLFKKGKKRDKFTYFLEKILCFNLSDSSFNHNNTIKE